MIGYGIDLSKWQDPTRLPWASFAGKVDFVIVRAAYGATRDQRAVEHVARARDIGAKVGLYIFFRIVESVESQLSALHAVADAAGLDDRDIVPAVDMEFDPFPSPGHNVAPSWSEPAERFVDELVKDFGNAISYITQREWGMMGSPSWVLRRPLWCANYVDHAPATPAGLPATIHQHRVGPFQLNGPGGEFAADGTPIRPGHPIDPNAIDQNRLLAPLPLVGQVVTDFERDRIEGLIAMSLTETVHPEWPVPPKDVA